MAQQNLCPYNIREKTIAVAKTKSKPGPRFYRPAHAKVNLFFHIKNRRVDGYHDIESLVVFADVCDHITVENCDNLELVVSGPFANALPHNNENLIIKAARLLALTAKIKPRARIHLEKILPVAAGIGGGSADAAATLLALKDLWQISINSEALYILASKLGADVPVCLTQSPTLVSGIGHDLMKVEKLSVFALLLANPRHPVHTTQVFRRLSPPFPIRQPWDKHIKQMFIPRLGECQNDLEPSACDLAPVISEVLQELQNLSGCQLARMSGSGATCFGLFDDLNTAQSAAQILFKRQKNWWVQASLVQV